MFSLSSNVALHYVAGVAGGISERASGGGNSPLTLTASLPKQKHSRWESCQTLHQSSHGFTTRINGFATKTKAPRQTLHQSSHGFASRVNGFATKPKALTREIPPDSSPILSRLHHSR